MNRQKYRDFLAAFDDFIMSLARLGQINSEIAQVVLSGNDCSEEQAKERDDATTMFETTRVALMKAREAISPLGVLPDDKKGTPEALWTPGRA